MRTPGSPADTTTAEHYNWGAGCDGWVLLRGDDLAIIEERMPAGTSEVRHWHARARQFFYVLDGVATFTFDDRTETVHARQGLHVPPGVRHCISNRTDEPARFLVISSPSTAGDRTNEPLEP